jgi:dihydroflavonol-4-reductase
VKVLVTGATGWVGSRLAAALVQRGDDVRVLRRKSSSTVALDGLPVEHVFGDVVDPESVRAAVEGCERVYHVAAVSAYWRSKPDEIYRVNVDGTRNVMEACLKAGTPRVVHTSSVSAVGIRRDGRPSDETQPFDPREKRFAYAHSKYLAELEVYKAVKLGLEAAIVNPAVVIGPGDYNLIAGTIGIEISKRPLLVSPPGGVCMVDIDAVVDGHLTAAERGRAGERYILGGENLTYRQIVAIVSEIAGAREPLWTLPPWLLPPVAAGLDVLNRFVNHPIATGDQLRLAAHNAFFDSGKAVAELGYRILPFRGAAERAYRWYGEHGFIT